LAGVPKDDVSALIAVAEPVSLCKRAALWQSDDSADTVYWLRSGVLRMERPGEDNRTLILRFHGRSDVFGVAALYSDRARGTRAVAHEEAIVFGVPVRALEDIARKNGPVALRLSDLLIQRQRRLEARLAGLIFQPVRARLRALFAELASDFGVRDSRGVILDLRLTHRQLAALIGTTRETVSLAVVRLRKDGWLCTEERRFILLRPKEMGVRVRQRRRRHRI
jgi:CRP-like cAMP-binding protein